MPTRNRVKNYGEDQYYHVYNRGVNKENIFQEEDDFAYFLSLFKRYLSPSDAVDKYGRATNSYNDEVELVAYCLMKNHYHLLFYLKEPDGLVHLMRSVMTAYTMYYNKKYQRSGGLYQGNFLAATITTDIYLWHVSRYIHLNPVGVGKNFRSYPYSSIGYFAGEKHAKWLKSERLVKTAQEREEYMKFVSDYETMHKELDHLKHVLAAE